LKRRRTRESKIEIIQLQKPDKKQKIHNPSCLVVAAGSVYSFYSRRQSRATDNTALPVVAAARGSISLSITGTGNVNPVRQQRLAPDITGKVEQILFSEGEAVKAGDLIYVLGNSDILPELKSNRINLDNTVLDYETTAEKIQNLEAKSPISGIIEELNITKDQKLSSGQVIATVVDKSTLKIKAPLNSLQKETVEVGQTAGP
jgi:HlyD family secretion protein